MTDRPTAPPDGILGFFSVLKEPSGYVGGYLLTNGWGRPMEFRLSSAVQPTRVQAILYGPTMESYLHGELIGKTLVEKASVLPGLILTDTPLAISLRSHVGIPLLCVMDEMDSETMTPLDAVKCSKRLAIPSKFALDREAVLARLQTVDGALDLAEPFVRLREAIAEARKAGGANRAA